jgi:ComF family protein
MEISRKTVDYLQTAIRWTLGIVFPPRCLGCRSHLPDHPLEYLCKTCERAIAINHGFECIECKAPVPLGITCRRCRPAAAIDQLLIATDFKDPLLQRIIKTYKYRYIHELSQPLSRILNQYITFLLQKKSYRIFSDNPIIVPVPLHSYRFNWRGFNQAETLATSLASTYQMISPPRVLVKKRYTNPQAQAENREARLAATEDLFACERPHIIEGRPVLLVDDVCTSGATLNACAKILKQHGAKNVYALVVARG